MIGHVIGRGQSDLADDGKREWDSEIKKSLDDEYPDWRNPETTHMIPDELHKQGNPGEMAEKIIFDLLKSFGAKRNEPMFVVHSFNFRERISEAKYNFLSPTRKKWNIGEHDFVLVHRQAGFVFLQVKASVKTAKAYGMAEKQLDKDRVAMKFYLQEVGIPKKKISTKDVDKLFSRFPGFVAMPNCPHPDSSASTYANGIFQEDCTSVEAFSHWWDRSIGSQEHDESGGVNDTVKEELFNLLVTRFVGLVLVSRCFASRHSIDDSFDALRINTKEQLKVHLDSTPDTWIAGPAGSGKTCLLIEKVIFLARDIISGAADQKILVVCYNRPLSLKIRRTIDHALKVSHVIQEQDRSEGPISVVDVKTFDKILKDINGSYRIEDGERGVAMALEKLQRDTSSTFKYSYDHIFVDEGQDLYHAEWPSLLKMMHKSSSAHAAVADDDLDPKYFWVFYDSNQHLHLSKKKTTYSDQLRNCKKLHQILRNTEKVFFQVRKYFEPVFNTSHTVRVYHREVGLEINWVLDDSLESDETSFDTNRGQSNSIVKQVEDLQRNDVQKRDICVLVKDLETRGKLIPNLQGVGIVCQNAEELWTEANNYVVVESIRRFKGLESKVVILYDPPYVEESKTRELLYTAISRCLCYLVVISTKEGCESLQSQAGLSGIPGAFPPGQLPASDTVDMDVSSLESTSMAFSAKRQFQDDDDSHYNQLYKKVKEIAGGSGHCLLGQGRNTVDYSVRDREFKSLLPSLWNHLQLFPEYTNATQPALNKIGALLEYRVLQKSKFGNYVGNIRAKVQEIVTSTQKKEMDVDVAGALKA